MTTAKECREALKEIMDVFPKKRVPEFFGHFNMLDLYLIEQVKREGGNE